MSWNDLATCPRGCASRRDRRWARLRSGRSDPRPPHLRAHGPVRSRLGQPDLKSKRPGRKGYDLTFGVGSLQRIIAGPTGRARRCRLSGEERREPRKAADVRAGCSQRPKLPIERLSPTVRRQIAATASDSALPNALHRPRRACRWVPVHPSRPPVPNSRGRHLHPLFPQRLRS